MARVGAVVRTLRLAAAAVALALAAPACAATHRPASTVAEPAGKAPLRYRDPVFTRVSVQRDVGYSGDEGLDLYTPTGDRGRDRPAVVWIHGGGFRTGTKANANVVQLATAFAQRGYVAASIDYRLLAQGVVCGRTPTPPPQCTQAALAAKEDARAAIGWLRLHARGLDLDSQRIAVGGTSAGAVTSLLLAADPSSRIGAAVSISGSLPGASFSRNDAPTLFFQGTRDRVVPYARAKATADAMARAGVPVVFEALRGAGHVPWQYRSRFITQSAWFLYARLGL
jgi:acetyl esterase/lipase